MKYTLAMFWDLLDMVTIMRFWTIITQSQHNHVIYSLSPSESLFSCPRPGYCVEVLAEVRIGQKKHPVLQGPAYSILCRKQEEYPELREKLQLLAQGSNTTTLQSDTHPYNLTSFLNGSVFNCLIVTGIT